MESCEHENGIMIFDSDDCPMCEAESRIQELEDELDSIKGDLDDCRADVIRLNKELEDANDENAWLQNQLDLSI